MKKQKKLFKYEIPDLKDYVGKTVQIPMPGGSVHTVKIKTVMGNVGLTLGRAPKDQRPQYAEINGRYRISFLRFFAQMNGAKDISEEDFKAYEDTEFWSEKMDNDKEQEIVIDPEAFKKGEVKLLKGKGKK